MAAAAAAAGGGGSGTASPTPRGVSIDVRIFLVVIAAAMAVSFGVGVVFGPTTTAELAAARAMAAQRQQQQQRSLLAAQEVAAGGGTVSMSLPAGTDQKDGATKRVIQPRRRPTAHAVELGARIKNFNESGVNNGKASYEDAGDGNIAQRASAHDSAGTEDEEGREDEYLPQGQHLLVDIKNVNAEFLNSEERLVDAMVELVKSAGLSLVSYHCHALSPTGVSCVGVLLESHISFHTWPEEGVITLDLFTCGPKPLLPVIRDIEAKFGLPRLKANISAAAAANPTKDDYEEVKTRWAHELRGFRHPRGRKNNYLDDQSDLALWVTSRIDREVKKQIVSTVTPFQRIDIWEVLGADATPTYKEGMKHNLTADDPRWLTNEIASPDSLLFLDGVLQSSISRSASEALVHPGMFAHPHPKRVAIIGGGEGATLREVLKHDTVTEVVMIEIDEMLVDIAEDYFSYLSDCSDLIGSEESCFDDERTTDLYEDGRAYFIDRYGRDAAENTEAKFDVIVLHALLDPEDDDFLTALYRSMSDDGVLSIPVGTAPTIHDPRADLGVYARREKMFKLLEDHSETAAMFVYEESHSRFYEPQSFLVVCKSNDCRKRWYAQPDEIDFAIYERIRDTESSEPALALFDGSTQRSYQIPPRAWETVYCRREPEPFECAYRGLDLTKEIHEFDWGDEEETSFEVKVSKGPDGKSEPRVYAATDDIKKGDYIMASDLAASFTVSDDSLDNLKKNTELVGTGRVTVIENLLEYVDRHGHRSIAPGSSTNYVEVGGSFMIRRSDNEAEVNIGKWIPTHPSGKIPVYSPVYERRMRSFDVFLVATRDIEEGEEIVKPVNLWA